MGLISAKKKKKKKSPNKIYSKSGMMSKFHRFFWIKDLQYILRCSHRIQVDVCFYTTILIVIRHFFKHLKKTKHKKLISQYLDLDQAKNVLSVNHIISPNC